MADLASREQIANAVRYSAKYLFKDPPDVPASRLQCMRQTARYVNEGANNTIMVNCNTRGLRCARIPQGPETCKFCIMLASRGFVYADEAKAGKYDKFHDDCDCRIALGFDDAGIEGYDPDELYQKWKELESGKTDKTPSEKLSSKKSLEVGNYMLLKKKQVENSIIAQTI